MTTLAPTNNAPIAVEVAPGRWAVVQPLGFYSCPSEARSMATFWACHNTGTITTWEG